MPIKESKDYIGCHYNRIINISIKWISWIRKMGSWGTCSGM